MTCKMQVSSLYQFFLPSAKPESAGKNVGADRACLYPVPCADLDNVGVVPCADLDNVGVVPCADPDNVGVVPCADPGTL